MPTTSTGIRDYYKYLTTQIYLNKSLLLCVVDPGAGIADLLTDSSTHAQVIARESTIAGAGRVLKSVTDVGVWDTVDGRWEVPAIEFLLEAPFASFDYYQLFTVVNGSLNRPKSFASADINIASDTVTIANHGLANGEAFVITLQPGSLLPAPLNTDPQPFIYTALNISTNTFQISKDGVSAVNLSGTGTGSFWLKYAKGSVERLLTNRATDGITPTIASLLAGQSKPYNTPLNIRQRVS